MVFRFWAIVHKDEGELGGVKLGGYFHFFQRYGRKESKEFHFPPARKLDVFTADSFLGLAVWWKFRFHHQEKTIVRHYSFGISKWARLEIFSEARHPDLCTVVSEGAVLSETTRVIRPMTAALSETARVIKSMAAVLSETARVIRSMAAVLSETARVIKSMPAVLSETARVIKSMTAVLSETTRVIKSTTAVLSETSRVIRSTI